MWELTWLDTIIKTCIQIKTRFMFQGHYSVTAKEFHKTVRFQYKLLLLKKSAFSEVYHDLNLMYTN